MDASDCPRATVYCFGEYRFIPDRQLLLHGDVPVRVGARALELLHAFVQRPGDVLSKEELIRLVWPSIFVHDNNLKVNIAGLRRALARDRSRNDFIATIPGRGYRFVAPLRVLAPGEETTLPDAVRSMTGELPPVPTLIGRDDDVAELADALGDAGLLTIVGPAGVGKTSVAIALARHVAERLIRDVCFVDLAAIEAPQFVVPAIALALGLNANFVNSAAGLADMLRDRRLILVLDNCEHLLSEVASVADYLSHLLPGLAILATSREPLRCRLETVRRLSPLQCPPEGDIGADAVITFPAVELLVRRAQEHGYQIDRDDACSLAAICRRLDGIALAIELAAPQVSARGAMTLRDLLGHSFEPLVSRDGGIPVRHTTLMATLDWSYRLLSENEARLLRHLSVPSGVFTLDDAIGIFANLAKAEDIASWLDNLAAKSLISSSYQAGGRRYRLLDSTRSFASERAVAHDEQGPAMAAYARFLLGLFQQAESEWNWLTREDWMGRYGYRVTDLRRAIDWAFEDANNLALGVQLTTAGIPLWGELSSVSEIRTRVTKALDAVENWPDCPPIVKMKLVAAHAQNLNYHDHDGADADRTWRQARRLADELGVVEYRLRTTISWIGARTFEGRHREVLPKIAELRTIVDAEGENTATPDLTRLELINRFYCGEIVAAAEGLRALAREHATIAHRSRTSRFQLDRFVGIRSYLAPMLWVKGEQFQAITLAREGVAAAATINHIVSHMHILGMGAISVALWCGHFDRAQEYVRTLQAQMAVCQIDIWTHVARFYQATIDASRGDASAIDRMLETIRELRYRNFKIHFPMHIVTLVESALSCGRLDIAQAVVPDVEDLLRRAEAWCAPELLRTLGLVRWKQGSVQAAITLLERATEAAEQSGAMSFQLRAAVSRCQLARQTGRDDCASTYLASIYERFDRRAESTDLLAARQLLMPRDGAASVPI
jgi:predicted ATPase/DNA-binding winged helix-turn-helix (wHTH) protein